MESISEMKEIHNHFLTRYGAPSLVIEGREGPIYLHIKEWKEGVVVLASRLSPGIIYDVGKCEYFDWGDKYRRDLEFFLDLSKVSRDKPLTTSKISVPLQERGQKIALNMQKLLLDRLPYRNETHIISFTDLGLRLIREHKEREYQEVASIPGRLVPHWAQGTSNWMMKEYGPDQNEGLLPRSSH